MIWDDGDDLHAEPRAPYPHARETLLLRAEREGAAALVGGFAMSVEADQLVRTGWAHQLAASREELRARVTVSVAGADEHALARDPLARATRVPTEVHRAIRDALDDRTGARADPAQRVRRGPCLRALPHARPLPGLHRPAGARLGHRATDLPVVRCRRRGLGLPRVRPPRPAGTGRGGDPHRGGAGSDVRRHRGPHVGWRPGAGLGRRRAGDRRGHPGRGAGGRRWLRGRRPAGHLAGARPGPPAGRGGGAAPLGQRRRPGPPRRSRGRRRRPGATPRSRRWSAGTRPGFAAREAAQRREAHLPPASRLATITGEPGAVDDAITLLAPPVGFELLGPVPFGGEGESRAVVRVPRSHGLDLSRALGEVQRVRSARKLDAVRIQVDPPTL